MLTHLLLDRVGGGEPPPCLDANWNHRMGVPEEKGFSWNFESALVIDFVAETERASSLLYAGAKPLGLHVQKLRYYGQWYVNWIFF